MALNEVTRLEELSLNSWPALWSIHYDGWIVRMADRFTDRSNSVWPIYESALDLDKKICDCEFLYNSFRQPAVFRIAGTKFTLPLDRRLDELGYTIKTVTRVQTCRIADLPLDDELDGINVDTTLTTGWSDSVSGLADLADNKDIYHSILSRIKLPAAYASILVDDTSVAVGLGVLEGSHVGIYGMITHPSLRRQGKARSILNGLLKWAGLNGATDAYLHVEADNTPAMRLYEKFGFKDIYQYWYRIQPEDL